MRTIERLNLAFQKPGNLCQGSCSVVLRQELKHREVSEREEVSKKEVVTASAD